MESNNNWLRDDVDMMPPRWSRLHTYAYDEYNETALDQAKRLIEYGPIKNYGVLIPVAAHQESGNIANAMDQYAAQEGADPFSVVLYLNSPEGSDQTAIDQTVDQVEQAIAKHPELDIRYAQNTYRANTPIGQIRKDLWDAAGLTVMGGDIYDTPDGEFIGINHDIDTVTIGRHYIRNIQNFYKAEQSYLNKIDMASDPMLPKFTQVKHAYPFETHPNIAKTMFWVDYSHRQHSPNGMYEEGLVVPLSYYNQQKGFDPKAQTYETERILAPAGQRDGIPGTIMETSPRRYIDRLGQNAISNIWTNESFGDNDACRDNVERADISHAEAEERVFDNLERDLMFFTQGIPKDAWQVIIYKHSHRLMGYSNGYSEEDVRHEVSALIRPKLRLAEQVLRRVVQSSTLADIVADGSTATEHIEGYADAILLAAEQDAQHK